MKGEGESEQAAGPDLASGVAGGAVGPRLELPRPLRLADSSSSSSSSSLHRSLGSESSISQGEFTPDGLPEDACVHTVVGSSSSRHAAGAAGGSAPDSSDPKAVCVDGKSSRSGNSSNNQPSHGFKGGRCPGTGVPVQEEKRVWRGARVAPYGANMVLVLYRAKGAPAR